MTDLLISLMIALSAGLGVMYVVLQIDQWITHHLDHL